MLARAVGATLRPRLIARVEPVDPLGVDLPLVGAGPTTHVSESVEVDWAFGHDSTLH